MTKPMSLYLNIAIMIILSSVMSSCGPVSHERLRTLSILERPLEMSNGSVAVLHYGVIVKRPELDSFETDQFMLSVWNPDSQEQQVTLRLESLTARAATEPALRPAAASSGDAIFVLRPDAAQLIVDAYVQQPGGVWLQDTLPLASEPVISGDITTLSSGELLTAWRTTPGPQLLQLLRFSPVSPHQERLRLDALGGPAESPIELACSSIRCLALAGTGGGDVGCVPIALSPSLAVDGESHTIDLGQQAKLLSLAATIDDSGYAVAALTQVGDGSENRGVLTIILLDATCAEQNRYVVPSIGVSDLKNGATSHQVDLTVSNNQITLYWADEDAFTITLEKRSLGLVLARSSERLDLNEGDTRLSSIAVRETANGAIISAAGGAVSERDSYARIQRHSLNAGFLQESTLNCQAIKIDDDYRSGLGTSKKTYMDCLSDIAKIIPFTN